jgi:hypothetical protein
MANSLNQSTVEDAALSWFGELGYAVLCGPGIAPAEPAAERESFGDAVLTGRLREAIDRLNAEIPHEARDEALRKVLLPDSPTLVGNNRKFHKMLRDGVEVEYRRDDGSIKGDHVRLIDFDITKTAATFRSIRGRHRQRSSLQNHRGLSSVSCCSAGSRGHRRSLATGRGSALWRGLAHARIGQELLHLDRRTGSQHA